MAEKEVAEEEKDTYRIEATLSEVGVLYPVLLDASGKHVIDGYHRLKVNPKWPALKLEHIQTSAQLVMARLLANIHSKPEKLDREEKTRLLGELAEKAGWTPMQIAEKLGMSYSWVRKHLPDKYKDEVKAEFGRLGAKATTKKLAARRAAERELESAVAPTATLPDEGGKPEAIVPITKPRVEKPLAPTAPEEEPELEIIYDGTVDERERYIEDLDLWFLKPGGPLLTALTKYCYDKEIHWQNVVEQALTEFFKKEGYL